MESYFIQPLNEFYPTLSPYNNSMGYVGDFQLFEGDQLNENAGSEATDNGAIDALDGIYHQSNDSNIIRGLWYFVP